MSGQRPRNIYEYRAHVAELYDLSFCPKSASIVGDGVSLGSPSSGCPRTEDGIDEREFLERAIQLHDCTGYLFRLIIEELRWNRIPWRYRHRVRLDIRNIEEFLWRNGRLQ